MAKLLNPAMSQEARGTIAGVTLNTSRSARYAKLSTAPAQRRTSRQLYARYALTFVAHGWRSRSAQQRTAWNRYAEEHTYTDWTGQTVRLSGYNWYCKLNSWIRQFNGANQATPPRTNPPRYPAAWSAVKVGSQIRVTWTPTGEASAAIIIYAHGPHSPGAQGNPKRARFVIRTAMSAGAQNWTPGQPGTYTIFFAPCNTTNGLQQTALRADVTV